MKKITLSIFAIILAISASAQTVGYGPRVGFNVATLSDRAFDARYNFNAGAFVEVDFSPRWSVELSAIYSRQGATQKDTPISLIEKANSTLCLDYMNAPLVVKYYPWQGLNVFLGPQFSFLVNAKMKLGDIENSVKRYFHTFDIGAVIGVGYTWECGMLVNLQYNQGLRPIHENSNHNKTYNGVVQLNVGWRF